ncbi:MAG: J domain-containing protein [Pseudomonadota bacterium]|nr:J domain-containing protein [Pseudomonadota bacterium]
MDSAGLGRGELMAWTGKVLGGVLGGMVGGPLGVGVGAAIGHYLADGEGAAASAPGRRELVVNRLRWRHHAFGPSGPGVRVTPVWRARRHDGRDVVVRVDAGRHHSSATVVPDTDDELCELPEFLLPYAAFEGSVRVRLESVRAAADQADFDVELPSPLRRLGSSGPARVVMTLVGAARAGGRTLTRDDIRFIRETFTAAHPLDDDGLDWLRRWLRALRDTDLERLAPDKVARRLLRHVEGDAVDEVVLWVMRGTRDVWPGAAAQGWVAELGDALGIDATGISALWGELDADADEGARAAARTLLGVPPDATTDEIRLAWRALVRTWHPDRAQGDAAVAEATRRVADINAAWRMLSGG